MRFAIQTALYKSSEDLPRLILSMQEQSVTDWKFFAYENSCDPAEYARVEKLLKESGIPYELYTGPENTGFAGGHNILFSKHEAEFILLLNDDSYLETGYLETVLARFEQDGNCAAVAGPIYRWTSSGIEKQQLKDETRIDTLGLKYRSLAEVSDIGSGDTRFQWHEWLQTPHRLFGVSGAVAVYRRVAVLQVSIDHTLFDPSFFMYKEDVDLAIRLARSGYSSWFEPKALSFHRRAIQGHKNLFARLRDERRRPAHLRVAMYRNQWAVYAYHFSENLGMRDVLRVAKAEILRAVGTFFISPWVFWQIWIQILRRGPRWLNRREEMQLAGLPLIRLEIVGS